MESAFKSIRRRQKKSWFYFIFYIPIQPFRQVDGRIQMHDHFVIVLGHVGIRNDFPPFCEGKHKMRHRMVGESRSEEHTSELQSREKLVCRLLLEKKKNLDCIYYDL